MGPWPDLCPDASTREAAIERAVIALMPAMPGKTCNERRAWAESAVDALVALVETVSER